MKIKKKHLTGRLANFTKEQVRKALAYAKQNSDGKPAEQLLTDMQSDGIGWAFDWYGTREGHAYWSMLDKGAFHLSEAEIKLVKQLRKLKPSDELEMGEEYYAANNQTMYNTISFDWRDDGMDNGMKKVLGVYRNEKDAAAVHKFLKDVRVYVDDKED